jgi:peptidoglycan/LPS O-acetylase OafA/YrhL
LENTSIRDGAHIQLGKNATRGDRLAYLDGLRFVAVIGVLLYHYLVRWAVPISPRTLYPFGDVFAKVPALQYGWLGVELFFIISGFVIALTLTRCRSPWEFFARRYSRLAPAMMAFSLVTFLFLTWVPSVPFPTSPMWFASSLTFLDPDDLNLLFGTHIWKSIDGVYWSLYVEVKFYVIAATLYFLSRERFHWILCAVALGGFVIKSSHLPFAGPLASALLIPGYLPWFIVGVGFYMRHAGEGLRIVAGVIGFGVSMLVALAMLTSYGPPLGAAIAVPLLFWACTDLGWLKRVLSLRVFSLIGAASYSLYLVHQEVGVSLIYLSRQFAHTSASGLVVVVATAILMIILAVASYTWLEKPLNKKFLKLTLSPPRNS